MATSTESLPPPGWDREGLDGLLNAFPEGRLSEIVGPRSSGGGSLLLALLARAASRGGLVALVDGADAFDPETAARAGLDLRALLWVRCGGRIQPAWSAADLLARCPGFAAVALDLGTAPPRSWFQCAACARAGSARPGAFVSAGSSPKPACSVPASTRAWPSPGAPGSSSGGCDAHRLPLRSRRRPAGAAGPARGRAPPLALGGRRRPGYRLPRPRRAREAVGR